MEQTAQEALSSCVEKVVAAVSKYADALVIDTGRAGFDCAGRRLKVEGALPGDHLDLSSDLCLGFGDDKEKVCEQRPDVNSADVSFPKKPPPQELLQWREMLSNGFRQALAQRIEVVQFVREACVCGEGLVRHHQYNLALEEVYNCFSERCEALMKEPSESVDAVTNGVRFYLGRCLALYKSTISRDESAQRQDTIDVLRDVLRDLVTTARMLNLMKESIREESYWAMYNACLLAMRVSRWLRLRGFGELCISSLQWLSQSISNCIPFVAVHMLSFRARLAEELIYCFEAAKRYGQAAEACSDTIKQVKKTEHLESMLPPVPSETEQVFERMVMRFKMLRQKYEYWNGGVPDVKQLLAPDQPPAPAAVGKAAAKAAAAPPPPAASASSDASLVMPLLLEVLQVQARASPFVQASPQPTGAEDYDAGADAKHIPPAEIYAKQCAVLRELFVQLQPNLEALETATKLLDSYIIRRKAYAESSPAEIEEQGLEQPLPPNREELQACGFRIISESAVAYVHQIEEALPLAAHALLTRTCLELEMQEDDTAISEIFDTLERTLALRLRYRHYLCPPLVAIDVKTSSQKQRDKVELPDGYEFLTTDLNEYSVRNRQIEAQQHEEIPEGTAIRRPKTPPKGTYIFLIGRRYNPWEHWTGEYPAAIRRLCNLRIVFAPAGARTPAQKEGILRSEGHSCFGGPPLGDQPEPWLPTQYNNSTTDTPTGFEVVDESERLRRSMLRRLTKAGDLHPMIIPLSIEPHPGSQKIGDNASTAQSDELAPYLVFDVFDERALWAKEQTSIHGSPSPLSTFSPKTRVPEVTNPAPPDDPPEPEVPVVHSEQVLPPRCDLLDMAVAATTPFNDLAVVASKQLHKSVPHLRFNALVRVDLRQTPGQLIGRPFQSYLFICTSVDAPCAVFVARRLRVMQAFRALRREVVAAGLDEETGTLVDSPHGGFLERQAQRPQLTHRFLEFTECVQQLLTGPCGHLFLLQAADLLEDISAFVFLRLAWKQLHIMQAVMLRHETGEKLLSEQETIYFAKWSAVLRNGLPPLLRILERVHAVDAVTLGTAASILAKLHMENNDARGAQAELGRAIARMETELDQKSVLGPKPAQDYPDMAAVAASVSFDPPSLRSPDFALFQDLRNASRDEPLPPVLVLKGIPRTRQDQLCMLARLYTRWIDCSLKVYLKNVESKVVRGRSPLDIPAQEAAIQAPDDSTQLSLSNTEAAVIARFGENAYIRALFFVAVARRRPSVAAAALSKACAEVEKARLQEEELWVYCEEELVEQQKAVLGFAAEDRYRPLAFPQRGRDSQQKPKAHPPMVHSRTPRSIRLRVPPLPHGPRPPLLPSSVDMHPAQQDHDERIYSQCLDKCSAAQAALTCAVYGKLVGTGTAVSLNHRDLNGTGVRHTGFDYVEITGLKPNTNYSFACMLFEGFDRSAVSTMSKTSPAIGTYYPLPLSLLRLEICRVALGIGSAGGRAWTQAWAPLFQSFTERVRRGDKPSPSFFRTAKLRLDVTDRLPAAILAEFAELLLAKNAASNKSALRSPLLTKPAQREAFQRANECLLATEAARRAGSGKLVLRGISSALTSVRALFRYRTTPRFLLPLLATCASALDDFQPSEHRASWHAKSRRMLTFLHHHLAVVCKQSGWLGLLWRQLEIDVPLRYQASALADQQQRRLADQGIFEQCIELGLFGDQGWQVSKDKAKLMLTTCANTAGAAKLHGLLQLLSERKFADVATEAAAIVLTEEADVRWLALSILRCAASRALELGGAEEAVGNVLANHPLAESLDRVLANARARLDSHGFMLRSVPPSQLFTPDVADEDLPASGMASDPPLDDASGDADPLLQLAKHDDSLNLAHLELTKAAPILRKMCGLTLHMHTISRFKYFDLEHILVPTVDDLAGTEEFPEEERQFDVDARADQEQREWATKQEQDKATRKEAFELLQELLVPLTRAAAYASAAQAVNLLQSAVVAALNALLIAEPSPEECVRPGSRSTPRDALAPPTDEAKVSPDEDNPALLRKDEVWRNLAILAEFAVGALTRLGTKSATSDSAKPHDSAPAGPAAHGHPVANQTRAMHGDGSVSQEELMVIEEAKRASRAMETTDEEFNEPWFDQMPELDVTSLGKVVAFAVLCLYHMRRWNKVVTLCRNFNDATCSVFGLTFLPLAIGAQKEVCSLSARSISLTGEYAAEARAAFDRNQKSYSRKHLRQLALQGDLSEAEMLFKKQTKHYDGILQRQRRLDESWKLFLRTMVSSHALAERACPAAVQQLGKSRMMLAQFLQEREAFGLRVRCGTLDEGERPLQEQILRLNALGLTSAYRKAVELLRKRQMVNQVVQALHELGNLQMLEGDVHGAQTSWSDAIDVAYQHVHAIKNWRKCVEDAVVPHESVARAETMLLSVAILAKHAQLTTPRHASCHVNAALFASAIVEKILTSCLPHPTKRMDFAPDRYRLREIMLGLRESHKLHPPNSVHTGADAASFLACLEFFQDTLMVMGYQQQRCLPMCSLYCHIATDVCRKPALVTKGELMMARALIQCKELSTAWHALRSVATSSDPPHDLLSSAFLDSEIDSAAAVPPFRTSEEPLSETNAQALSYLMEWTLELGSDATKATHVTLTTQRSFALLQCEFCLTALAYTRIFSEADDAKEKCRTKLLAMVFQKLTNMLGDAVGHEEQGIEGANIRVDNFSLRAQCLELQGDLGGAAVATLDAMRFMQKAADSGISSAKECGFAEGPSSGYAGAPNHSNNSNLRAHADMKRWLGLRRRMVSLLVSQGRIDAALSHIEHGVKECGRAHDEVTHVELLAARARLQMMTGRLLELRGDSRVGALSTVEKCLAVSAKHLPVPTMAAVQARMMQAVIVGQVPALNTAVSSRPPSAASACSDDAAGTMDANTLAELEAKNKVVVSPMAKALQQGLHQKKFQALQAANQGDRPSPVQLRFPTGSDRASQQQVQVSRMLHECIESLDSLLAVQGFELHPLDINCSQHFGPNEDGNLDPVPEYVLPRPASIIPCPMESFAERPASDSRDSPNMYLDAMPLRLHCEVHLAQMHLDLGKLEEAQTLLMNAEQRMARCVHLLPWLFVQFCVVKLRWRRHARKAGLIPTAVDDSASNDVRYTDPQMFADGLSPATTSGVYRTFLRKTWTPFLAKLSQWSPASIKPSTELLVTFLHELFGSRGVVELSILEAGHDCLQLSALFREGIEEVLYAWGKAYAENKEVMNLLYELFSCLVSVADHHKAFHYENPFPPPVVEDPKTAAAKPKAGGDTVQVPTVEVAALPTRIGLDLIRLLRRQEHEGALAYLQPDVQTRPVPLRTLAKQILAMQRESSMFCNMFHNDRFVCDQLHATLMQVSEPYVRAKVLDKSRLKNIVERGPDAPCTGQVLIHWTLSEQIGQAATKRPLLALCYLCQFDPEDAPCRRPLVARVEPVTRDLLQQTQSALGADLENCKAAETVAVEYFSQRLKSFARVLRGMTMDAGVVDGVEEELQQLLSRLVLPSDDLDADAPRELLDARSVEEALKVLIHLLDVSSVSIKAQPLPELGAFLHAVLAPLSVGEASAE